MKIRKQFQHLCWFMCVYLAYTDEAYSTTTKKWFCSQKKIHGNWCDMKKVIAITYNQSFLELNAP